MKIVSKGKFPMLIKIPKKGEVLMSKYVYSSHDVAQMRKALLNTKAIFDAIQNGTIEIYDDSMEVFDPVNHRYSITTVLAIIRNNTYAALGADLPTVSDWHSQFPIIKQSAAGNPFADPTMPMQAGIAGSPVISPAPQPMPFSRYHR